LQNTYVFFLAVKNNTKQTTVLADVEGGTGGIK
jgi:hypothetical protein